MNLDIKKVNFKKYSYTIFFILIILYLPMLYENYFSILYKGFFSTSTFLGIFSFYGIQISLLFYKLTLKKFFVIYVLLFIILLILSKVRTAWLGLLISIVLYYIFSIKNIDKFIWVFIKFLFFIIIFSLIYIYPNIDRFSWYQEFSNMVYNISGKILMSGRNRIWLNAINIFKQKPFFGYGFSAFSNLDISPHNSYIAVLIQSGLYGIITLMLFVSKLFDLMYNKRKNNIVRMCAVFFISNLIMCSFEVMLFQGQIVLSILFWTIVGIGVNKNLN